MSMEAAFSNPSQLCPHGNVKGRCSACDDAKEGESMEKNRAVGKNIAKEKFDYSNPEHLKELLTHPDQQIDSLICSTREFYKVSFGAEGRFKKMRGGALLRNFGTQKVDTENMISLFNFAGIAREHKKPEPDYANPEHLNELLKYPDDSIDLLVCGLEEFLRMSFGSIGRFENKMGMTLLKNFGTQKTDTENMIALLNFAGIAREQKKPEPDYANPEHLKELLMHPNQAIDLLTCDGAEFKKTFFGIVGRLEKRRGRTLLRNFGTKKDDTENMIALLNFAGIAREQFDYTNPEHIKELLTHPDQPIDLLICGSAEFHKTSFGFESKFEKRIGEAVLKNFGTKKTDTENMIALLNFAGIAREQKKPEPDYANPEHLKELLMHPNQAIDLSTCGNMEFIRTSFGTGSRFEKRAGSALLRNFGTKKTDMENIIALLNFAGIDRDQKKPESDYANPEHLKELLAYSDQNIDLSICGTAEFINMSFGVGSRFEKKMGATLLKNFGTKKTDTENMIALLNFAGIAREQFDYADTKHLKELLTHPDQSINLSTCGVAKFLKTSFGVGSRFEKRTGVTLLKKFGTQKVDIENMIDLINFIFPEINRKNVVAENREAGEKQAGLEQYLEELSQGKMDAEKMGRAIALLGSSKIADILFHFHPEFHGLPMEYVHGELAEYLGEFMSQKRPLDWAAFAECREIISGADLRESVIEVAKEKILGYCQEEQKKSHTDDIRALIKVALDRLQDELIDFDDDELWEMIGEAESYYFSLLELKKPDCIVDSLKAGRTFPDINQLINIQEIKDKKKMLIADDMGLGKSASAILTKEYLGLRNAIIIVPKNVQETWQGYLSDQKKGYFKKGLAPKVLIVESQTDLARLEEEIFDYVIISHEKMNDTYAEILGQQNFDMAIVDEAHKIKNTRGVRFQNVEKVTQKIHGEDNYLALLSGTPVPNKVSDVAMTLRLLYPEKFEPSQANGDEDATQNLTHQIITSDTMELRNLLVARMQKKDIAKSIMMPELIMEEKRLELSGVEKDIYETLLDEDEITASQKIQIMRQFLLNPQILDITAGEDLVGSKVLALREELAQSLQTDNKVVVFVNDYVEGVIRGEKSIIEQLDLPDR
ncbi:MAG: SNF2-related protein, partial [Parcubacteria group bacterium]